MKATFAKLTRRLIRHQLGKTTPEKLLQLSEKKLLRAFKRAAQHSSAYRTLLQEHGTNINAVNSPQSFVASCPITEKANTFRRFPIAQLLAGVKPEQLGSILTSSGHGSSGFAIGLSTRAQCKTAAAVIDFGLELAFDIDTYRTLLINCLPMGVTFQSEAVCVANVSVREDMACAIVEQAGASFEQIILCGDPLFLKKLLDFSITKGINWRQHRVNVIIGEETFSETFRDYVALVLHINQDQPNGGMIGSSMGVGELGLNLFNETKETIALRRACANNPALISTILGEQAMAVPLPTFMVFNPLRTFVEVIDADAQGNGDLLVSMLDAEIPIPLMRYKTGDRAKLLKQVDRQRIIQALGEQFALPNLPMIVLHGRAKDYFSDGTHLDAFKQALYLDKVAAHSISGAFRVNLKETGFVWEVQLQRGSAADPQDIVLRLKTALPAHLRQADIQCYSYDDFPYGKSLDYERKFVYLT